MSRQHREEVDVDKFRVNHNIPAVAGDRVESIGYGMDGLVLNDTDGPACLAKWVRQLATGTTRYFVKFSNVGPTAGTMVDPVEENDMARSGDWTANGRFTFRPVTKTAFDYYVRFLKTRNRAYLWQAGREATL